jgi:hypothetical protein
MSFPRARAEPLVRWQHADGVFAYGTRPRQAQPRRWEQSVTNGSCGVHLFGSACLPQFRAPIDALELQDVFLPVEHPRF